MVLAPVLGLVPASQATAGPTVYASDSFNRTVTGGWGTADVGGAWNTTGPAYAVTPGSATIQADMTTPTNFLASSVSVQDVDVLTKVTPAPISSAYVDAGVGVRFQAGGGNFYQVSAYYASQNNNGNYTVELKRKPDNSQINPDANTLVPGGSPFWIRFEAQGTNPTILRWKIWADTAPEPLSWTATGSDNTPVLQAAGGVGVEAYANSGSEKVAFNTFSASQPLPPVPVVTCTSAALACDTFNRTVTNGWGSADIGGPWSAAGSIYGVSPGSATIAADGSAPTNFLTSVSAQDVDALAKVSPPGLTSNFIDSGLGVRATAGSGSFYQLSTYYSTSNNGGNYTVELKTQPANSQIVPDFNTTIPGGTPIWLRLQAQGSNPTTLRAKIWADGTIEPTTWTETATDSTAGLQGAGGIAALKAYSNVGTSTVAFNGLLVSPIARIATTVVATPAVVKLFFLTLYFPKVSATLTAGNPAVPLANQLITFRSGTAVICTASTDSKGVASCSGSLGGLLNLIVNVGYDAVYAGNASYLPSSGHGPLTRVF